MSLSVSSWDSNSISTLFSSLSTSSSSSSSSTGIESLIGDYSSLTSGSYGKLLKAYYAKSDSSSDTSSASDSTKKQVSEIKSDSSELNEAASALLSNGSDSVWNKVQVKNEDGTTSEEYDKDKIYSAVSDFVDGYNDLVDSGQESSNTGILTQVAGMVNATKSAYSTLAQVGITIDSKNHLSIDEDFFKNDADMTTVKSLFNGSGSYAYNISSKASMVKNYATSSLALMSGNSLYTNSGSYSLSSSDILSSLNTSV